MYVIALQGLPTHLTLTVVSELCCFDHDMTPIVEYWIIRREHGGKKRCYCNIAAYY